jgi:hypothetical protein
MTNTGPIEMVGLAPQEQQLFGNKVQQVSSSDIRQPVINYCKQTTERWPSG